MRKYQAKQGGVLLTATEDGRLESALIVDIETFLINYEADLCEEVIKGCLYYETAKYLLEVCWYREGSEGYVIEPSSEVQEYLNDLLVKPDPEDYS